MKKIMITVLALAVLTIALCACQKEKSVFDRIRESTVARMDLSDGTSIFVDSEIASLRSLADLELHEAPMEPADSPEDWLYRIVFDPSDKVKGDGETVVSFHADYVQIDEEFYLPKNGVAYESILEWAKSKFDYFLKSAAMPEDFTLSFSWWFMPERKNIMDTEIGSLQKDLVLDGTAEASFSPDEVFLESLYDIVCEQDLKSIQREMTSAVLTKDKKTTFGVEPNTYYVIKVTMNGETFQIRGDATSQAYIRTDEDARRFSDAVRELRNKAESLPEWKAMPEANGAYE